MPTCSTLFPYTTRFRSLGFAGALFHIVNHAILKTLMFSATGLVEHDAGTDDLARLGGLLGRMPVVGTCVGLGALALSGMPVLRSEEHTSELQSRVDLVCRRALHSFPTRRASDLWGSPARCSTSSTMPS